MREQIQKWLYPFVGEYRIELEGKTNMRISMNANAHVLSWTGMFLSISLLAYFVGPVLVENSWILGLSMLFLISIAILALRTLQMFRKPQWFLIIDRPGNSILMKSKNQPNSVEVLIDQQSHRLLVKFINQPGKVDSQKGQLYLIDETGKECMFLLQTSVKGARLLGKEIAQFSGLGMEELNLVF